MSKGAVIHTATFTNGMVIRSPLRDLHGYTHAWLSLGRLKSGKTWTMSGFSRSEKTARARMRESTIHLRGTPIDFAEIAAAHVVTNQVMA